MTELEVVVNGWAYKIAAAETTTLDQLVPPVCGYHQLVELRAGEIPHSQDCWLGQELYA